MTLNDLANIPGWTFTTRHNTAGVFNKVESGKDTFRGSIAVSWHSSDHFMVDIGGTVVAILQDPDRACALAVALWDALVQAEN